MTQPLSRKTFIKALGTMNESIKHNQDALFFQALLQECRSLPEDELLEVALYRDDPRTPSDYYRLKMNDGAFRLVDQGKHQTDSDWTVSETYIRDLAENRKKYVDHPEKLSLNWLVERLVAMKMKS